MTAPYIGPDPTGDLILLDAIDAAVSRVRVQVAAALIAGDDLEAGRIIREAVNVRLASIRELERPSDVSDEELAEAFRDVYAANDLRAAYREKQRDDAREVWAEMTAEVRAHEAGE